jgi:tetratricopeptide (TPR) repeat protein
LLATFLLAACGGETEPTEVPVSVEEHFKKGNEFAQSGDFESAIVEYEAALELEPDNVSALTNLGVAYYSTGDLDGAIAQYNKAIEIAPEDADIYSNLAAAYVQKGQLDKALETYETAVKHNPDLAEAHFGLGVIHLQMGNADGAIEAFEKFQELDTGNDPTATEQAELYLQQLKGE